MPRGEKKAPTPWRSCILSNASENTRITSEMDELRGAFEISEGYPRANRLGALAFAVVVGRRRGEEKKKPEPAALRPSTLQASLLALPPLPPGEQEAQIDSRSLGGGRREPLAALHER